MQDRKLVVVCFHCEIVKKWGKGGIKYVYIPFAATAVCNIGAIHHQEKIHNDQMNFFCWHWPLYLYIWVSWSEIVAMPLATNFGWLDQNARGLFNIKSWLSMLYISWPTNSCWSNSGFLLLEKNCSVFIQVNNSVLTNRFGCR